MITRVTQYLNAPIQLVRDERGVSIAVDTALGILILIVLSSVLVAGVTSVEDSREQAVAEQELDRIADDVAAGLVAADMLGQDLDAYDERSDAEDASTGTVRVDLPSHVVGHSYSVGISETNEDGETEITVTSQNYEGEAVVELENEVETGASPAGDLSITVDNDDGTITITGVGS